MPMLLGTSEQSLSRTLEISNVVIMWRRQPKLDRRWQFSGVCVLRTWEESSTLSTTGNAIGMLELLQESEADTGWLLRDENSSLVRLMITIINSKCFEVIISSQSVLTVPVSSSWEESSLIKIAVFKRAAYKRRCGLKEEHIIFPFVTKVTFTNAYIWLNRYLHMKCWPIRFEWALVVRRESVCVESYRLNCLLEMFLSHLTDCR